MSREPWDSVRLRWHALALEEFERWPTTDLESGVALVGSVERVARDVVRRVLRQSQPLDDSIGMPGVFDLDLNVFRMTLPLSPGSPVREVYLWPQPPIRTPVSVWVVNCRVRTMLDVQSTVRSRIWSRLGDIQSALAQGMA